MVKQNVFRKKQRETVNRTNIRSTSTVTVTY